MEQKKRKLDYWIFFLGLFIVFFLYGVGSYKDWKILHDRKFELEAQFVELELEKKRLWQEINNLNDSEYIEILARQKLGLVRPGEIVYDFRTQKKQGQPETESTKETQNR